MSTIKNITVIWAVFLVPYALCLMPCMAQQTPEFSQYMLNSYGLNPAVCGLAGHKNEVLIGRRTQWIGMPDNPLTNFFNYNTYFGRKGNFSQGWHGVGAYWEGDRQGTIFKSDNFYLSYTYHLKMTRYYHVAMGLAAGTRRYSFRMNDVLNDPALNGKIIWLSPDFIPGVKLYNGKWAFDISVKQLTKRKAKQGSTMIGSPSKLPPVLYFTASRKWWARSYLLIIQSAHVKYAYSSLPTFEYNMLAYLNKNFAVGMTYRHLDAVVAMVQFRFDKLVVGFAYDFTIAPYRFARYNSQEIMLGMSPSPWSESQGIRQGRVAECPSFHY